MPVFGAVGLGAAFDAFAAPAAFEAGFVGTGAISGIDAIAGAGAVDLSTITAGGGLGDLLSGLSGKDIGGLLQNLLAGGAAGGGLVGVGPLSPQSAAAAAGAADPF